MAGHHFRTFLALNFALIACCVVDVAAIFFNPARRALHDYLAGSYVITKRSFMAVRGLGPPPMNS